MPRSRPFESRRSAVTARRSNSAGFRRPPATSFSRRLATRSECRPTTGIAAPWWNPTTSPGVSNHSRPAPPSVRHSAHATVSISRVLEAVIAAGIVAIAGYFIHQLDSRISTQEEQVQTLTTTLSTAKNRGRLRRLRTRDSGRVCSHHHWLLNLDEKDFERIRSAMIALGCPGLKK